MVRENEKRRDADGFVRQIKIIVYSGLILAVVTGVATQVTIALKVQNNLVTSTELLKQNFKSIEKQRTDDALRQQSNSHDMALAIDAIRTAVWNHTSPNKVQSFTPLADKILDVPIDKKIQINQHIGNVPLVPKEIK